VDSLSHAKKIVFLGDSLTEGVDGASYLRALGERLADDARLPPIDLINAGQGGDTVRNLARRVSRDVVPHAPDSVVVFVGVNDCRTWYVRRSPPTLATVRSGYYFLRRKGIWRAMTPQRFERGLRALVADLRAQTAARIALCTPATASESRDPRAEHMLDQYARAVRQVARERDCALIDVRAAMLEAIGQSGLSATSGLRLTIDGVHLSDVGARHVAAVFHEWLLTQFSSPATR
jgi:lysophospholipase L1-like esterase